jgi:hypothetical protein
MAEPATRRALAIAGYQGIAAFIIWKTSKKFQVGRN